MHTYGAPCLIYHLVLVMLGFEPSGLCMHMLYKIPIYSMDLCRGMEPWREMTEGEGGTTNLVALPLEVKDQRKQCHVEAEDKETVTFGEAIDGSNDILRTRHRGSSASTQGRKSISC